MCLWNVPTGGRCAQTHTLIWKERSSPCGPCFPGTFQLVDAVSHGSTQGQTPAPNGPFHIFFKILVSTQRQAIAIHVTLTRRFEPKASPDGDSPSTSTLCPRLCLGLLRCSFHKSRRVLELDQRFFYTKSLAAFISLLWAILTELGFSDIKRLEALT